MEVVLIALKPRILSINLEKTSKLRTLLAAKQKMLKKVVSKNVVYMIQFPCGKMHKGETSRFLKEHITEHWSSIKRTDETFLLARYFNEKHFIFIFFTGIEEIKSQEKERGFFLFISSGHKCGSLNQWVSIVALLYTCAWCAFVRF